MNSGYGASVPLFKNVKKEKTTAEGTGQSTATASASHEDHQHVGDLLKLSLSSPSSSLASSEESQETPLLNQKEHHMEEKRKIKIASGHFVTVHKATLEDFVRVMPRGANITYPKDAAAICMVLLNLRDGCRVLEAGTGSGSMTLFLSRAVGPNGRVDSWEIRSTEVALGNIRRWFESEDSCDGNSSHERQQIITHHITETSEHSADDVGGVSDETSSELGCVGGGGGGGTRDGSFSSEKEFSLLVEDTIRFNRSILTPVQLELLRDYQKNFNARENSLEDDGTKIASQSSLDDGASGRVTGHVRNITVYEGDVGLAALPMDLYDGVMLDMMEPWLVLKSVVGSLKVDSPLVCLLPNILQITNLLQHITDHSIPLMVDRVIEVFHREWDIRAPYVSHPSWRQIGHTAFLVLLKRVRPA